MKNFKMINLPGLAEICRRSLDLHGVPVKMVPSGTPEQIECLTAMEPLWAVVAKQATGSCHDRYMTVFASASKDVETINRILRNELKSSMQLTASTNPRTVYACSQDKITCLFSKSAEQYLLPLIDGRTVPGGVVMAEVFKNKEYQCASVEDRNGVYITMIKRRDGATLNTTSTAQLLPFVKRLERMGFGGTQNHQIHFPIVSSGELSEIDISWLKAACLRPEIEFSECKAEGRFVITTTGIGTEQITAASSILKSLPVPAAPLQDPIRFDSEFMVVLEKDGVILSIFVVDPADQQLVYG